MQEFIVGILDSSFDYNNISRVILIYLVSLWLMISLWVFFDAKKRFSNLVLAVILFLAVFIFNFPALIFYLIIRPEDEGHFHHGHQDTNGGLNIPVANFIDKDGNLDFIINIKLNSSRVEANSVKMNIEGNKSIVIEENLTSEEKPVVVRTKKGNEFLHNIKKKVSDIRESFVKASKHIFKKISKYNEKVDEKSENNEKK